MEGVELRCASIRAQIVATEADLARLKRELAVAEQAAVTTQNTASGSQEDQKEVGKGPEMNSSKWPLLEEEYRRYGRQMIVEQIGLKGRFCPSVAYHDWDSREDPFTDRYRLGSFFPRPTQAQICKGPDRRSRWTGLPVCNVPCWGRGGDSGIG